MKYTKNHYYKLISEKLNDKTYNKHYTIHYYLREILCAYNIEYDANMTLNRMLKDFATVVTGETYDKHYTNHYYLRTIAENVSETIMRGKTEHYYLKTILEHISLGLKTSLLITVPSTVIYSDSFNITGLLVDEENNPLTGVDVKLLIDNTVKQTIATDSNGEVEFTETLTSIGEHTFKLVFDGVEGYNKTESETVTRTVGKETSVLTLTSPVNNADYDIGETITITGTLLTDDGEAIANATILDTVTDSNGAFTTTTTYDSDGTKTLTVTYDGNDTYTSDSVSRTIVINPILDSIILSSNKNILSYYDSDTATLTAQLLDNNGDPYPLENVSVEFFKDNISIGTAITNSNGIATKTINSNNDGTVTFKAEYSAFTSNNVTIEDIYKFYDCITDDGNWNIKSGASISFDSDDGAYIAGTAKTVTYNAYNIQYPESYSVELEITKIKVSTVPTQICVEGATMGSSTSSQIGIGDIVKLEYDKTNNIVTVYRNNQLISSLEADSTYPGLTFRTYSGRGIGVKNMKIKEII